MTKPPYRVPLMSEIAGVPWNGFTAASLFSGGGGSTTGYKMAGFRVGYANEFIPEAAATYRANHKGTHVDPRDVRLVHPNDILKACGVAAGGLDLLDGSPPCSSFSTAGKGAEWWGKVKKYSDSSQRTDDLFFQFVRLVDGVKPRAFVAENVSGLIKGKAKGYFLQILAALKACGYAVEARLLNAQWLGVPQARVRLIFVGVRADLAAAGIKPTHPKPLPYFYTVREAIPWIVSQGANSGFGTETWQSSDNPSPTIGSHTDVGNGRCPPGHVIVAPSLMPAPAGDGARIDKFAIGEAWADLKPGEDSERFYMLKKAPLDAACQTVTAGGGVDSRASVTHPTEKRKFTIAELRRVCAFPDDYVLTGDFAQQWERMGRAVPPVMMSHIAAAVRDHVLTPGRAVA